MNSQSLSNSFCLTLIPLKTNCIQNKRWADDTEHALTTNLACIFFKHLLFIRRNERQVYCYYSKANYYENYHLLTSLTKCRRKYKKTLVE